MPTGPEKELGEGTCVSCWVLQRDLTLVLQVIGQVDRGHAALTQLTLDGVAAFEGCVQAGDGIGHGGQHASKTCGAASISNEQCGASIRATQAGERPKPLPHPKTVYVVVYVGVH